MKQKEIEIKAQDDKARQEADAYYDRVTIGAEAQFYKDGKPLSNNDLELPYPDLSKYEIYKKANRDI